MPYPPGGPTDIVSRAVAQQLGETWGQQVVVDQRPGAGGVIGTEIAARAIPDGHTLVLGTGGAMIITPLVVPSVRYHPLRDFTPISNLVISTQILVAHPSVPAGSVKELIALAKAKPGALNFGSVGVGSPNHLGGELLKAMAGIDMVHVPYKGTAAAMADLIGGQLQVMFNSTPTVLGHIQTGRLKVIATAGARRSASLPGTPTVAETLPGFEVTSWFGVLAPAGLPRKLVDRINADLARAVAQPKVTDLFVAQGLEPNVTTPDALARYMERERDRWARVIRAAGIRAE